MARASRTPAILGRFPAYLGAEQPGKLIGEVVDALAFDLDVLTAQLGDTRRAHRVGHAASVQDLLGLAGLHGIGTAALELLDRRLRILEELARVLDAGTGGSSPAKTAAAALLGVTTKTFGELDGALLLSLARNAASHAQRLAMIRRRLLATVALHREGNGTVGALLGATAVHLDLMLLDIVHSADGTWHVARCQDAMRAALPAAAVPRPASGATDVLVLEENPARTRAVEPMPHHHADVFHVLRPGFEAVAVTTRIVGVADRTVTPMVVDVGAGFGVAFLGAVPDGKELRIEQDGTVTLDGADASPEAFCFHGAVFADAAAPHQDDFVFAEDCAAGTATGRAACFPTTRPVADAFATAATLAAGKLEGFSLRVGETRLAFSVRAGHFGLRSTGAGAGAPALPITVAGLFDRSTFAPDDAATAPAAGRVGFAWQEPEPFAVRLWLPNRVATLDGDCGPQDAAELVRQALDHHRAAGVHVYVAYQDDNFNPPAGLLEPAPAPQ